MGRAMMYPPIDGISTVPIPEVVWLSRGALAVVVQAPGCPADARDAVRPATLGPTIRFPVISHGAAATGWAMLCVISVPRRPPRTRTDDQLWTAVESVEPQAG